MSAPPQLELSIVVASVDADRSLGASLEALERACKGLTAEILVIGACLPARPPHVAAGPVRYIEAPASRLAPGLWADGIAHARGRIVALTTAHFVVQDGWARALIEGLASPAAGVGGPMTVAPSAGLVDWAVFYLRYSAFLASRWQPGLTSEELAGDNAAYRLEDLKRFESTFARGFSEVDFHRRLRAEGRPLCRVRGARADLGRSFRARTFLRHRFEHGREFGRTDIEGGHRRRARLLLGAPAVPLVLAWRAARRVGVGADTWRFAASLPLFLVFATAWAAGEAAGAISAAGPLGRAS